MRRSPGLNLSLSPVLGGLRRISRESWVLFVALSFTNGSNYLFHVLVSRELGPAEYGALGAVLAFLIALSVPLSSLQTTVAKRLAVSSEDDATRTSVWGVTLKSSLRLAVGLSALLALASPLLVYFLHLDSEMTALLIASYVIPAVGFAVLRGALQGSFRFKALALVSGIPVIFRLAFGVTAVNQGMGVPGAVLATVLAEALGFLLSLWLLGGRPRIQGRAERPRKLLKEIGPALSGLGAMWVLIELDLVLARHFLPNGEAGSYAAAGMLARAVLFVPGAISLIALPRFARSRGRGREAHLSLIASTLLVGVLGIIVAGLLTVARSQVVNLTFGEQFADAADLLPTLSMAMVFLGVANLLVFFHIAAGSRAFNLIWVFVAGEAVSVALMHSSGIEIGTVTLIVGGLTALVGLVSARSLALSPPPWSRLPGDLYIHDAPPLSQKAPSLSLVVPTYNGGPALLETVGELARACSDLDCSYELVVVSDGSTDGSAQNLARMLPSVSVVHYPRHQGKGVALRVGMRRARGEYVAFVDGDGDIDGSELKSFLALMELYNPHVILGSKRHPLSKVEYPTSRRALSWVYQRLVRVLFGINVRDTQTGMKLIRKDVLDKVLPRMLEKRFAFDLEFLVVAELLGYNRFFEAPIRINYQFKSTVSPGSAFRILLDTAAIYYRRYILRYYDSVDQPASPSIADAPVELPLLAAVEAATLE